MARAASATGYLRLPGQSRTRSREHPYGTMRSMEGLRVLEFIRHSDPVWNLPRELVEDLRRRFPDVTFLSPADRDESDRLLPAADVVLGWAVRPDNFARAERLRWIQVTAASVAGLLFPALVA